jgi:hypothetical protein
MESVTTLEKKVREEAQASLCTFLGAPEGGRVWREACSASSLPHADAHLSFSALEEVAHCLRAHRGPTALVGHSLSIQARTYQMLARARRLDAFLEGGTP